MPPCNHTGDPRCRYAFSLGRPCQRHRTGDFPGPPLDPVNGSVYTCARETYTYRETLDLRGSGLPPGPPAAPGLWCLSAALRATPVVATDSPRRDPVSGKYRGIFRVRRQTRSMGGFRRAFVLYTYRETLNLRGSDLPIPTGIHFACRAVKTPIDSLQPYGRALLSLRTLPGETPLAARDRSLYACALVLYTSRGTANLTGIWSPRGCRQLWFEVPLCSPTGQPRRRYGLSRERSRQRHRNGGKLLV